MDSTVVVLDCPNYGARMYDLRSHIQVDQKFLFCYNITMNLTKEVKMEQETTEVSRFNDYVFSFYSEDKGVYPIKGLTKKMVSKAVHKYIMSLDDDITWGGGDSLDRERVRYIILEDYAVEMA